MVQAQALIGSKKKNKKKKKNLVVKTLCQTFKSQVKYT